MLGIVPTDMTRCASVVYQLIFNNSACVYEGKEEIILSMLLCTFSTKSRLAMLHEFREEFSNEGPKSTYVAPQY